MGFNSGFKVLNDLFERKDIVFKNLRRKSSITLSHLFITDGGTIDVQKEENQKTRVGISGCGSVCGTPFLVEVKFIDGGIH